MAGKKLTGEQRAEIVRRNQAGERPVDLAKSFGVHRVTIHNVISLETSRKKRGGTSLMLSARLSQKEFDSVEDLAKKYGFKSRSRFMRSVVRRMSGYFEADPKTLDALKTIKTNLDRIGGNVNQIATNSNVSMKKLGHSQLSVTESTKMDQLQCDIDLLKAALMDMLNNSQVKAEVMAQRLAEGED